MLNDRAAVEMAHGLATIIDADGVEAAFRRCTGRRPETEELKVLAALDPFEVARVLLNLDETITRE